MNCDRIAPFYRSLETIAFGPRLQKHRTMYLSAAAHATRVLVLGDGDGRFTQALIHAYPHLEVDSIDVSAGMLAQAGKRLDSPNVHLIQADVLHHPLANAHYDIVYSHFFLDCFDTRTAAHLVTTVSHSLRPHATWIISDFRQLDKGWRKLITRACLQTMYFFFLLATGLKTHQLPDHASALQANGFKLTKECVSLAGFIASEWWQA